MRKFTQSLFQLNNNSKSLTKAIGFRFAEEKDENYLGTGKKKSEVQIDQKYRLKSAALYDKYLESRERPLISLDNYQVNYCWIIERIPIFFPHNEKYFQFYKNRYQMVRKAGYYTPIPKQLCIQKGDYLFQEYEKSNPQNTPSHETMIKGQTQIYRENARYWRHVDPQVTDDRSIQKYSSDNVFMIVQNSDRQWIFPERAIAQKQSHQDFFKGFAQQLFAGQAYPNLHFGNKKPIYSYKRQIQNMPKGKGINTFYFSGQSMSGIPKFPTNQFKDFKWVTKPEMAQYFSDEYYKKMIRLIRFQF